MSLTEFAIALLEVVNLLLLFGLLSRLRKAQADREVLLIAARQITQVNEGSAVRTYQRMEDMAHAAIRTVEPSTHMPRPERTAHINASDLIAAEKIVSGYMAKAGLVDWQFGGCADRRLVVRLEKEVEELRGHLYPRMTEEGGDR
jgi:hypothetical protein